ncbi:MAG: hypothetical protein ACPGU5_08395 [Lishizhenia sp.]
MITKKTLFIFLSLSILSCNENTENKTKLEPKIEKQQNLATSSTILETARVVEENNLPDVVKDLVKSDEMLETRIDLQKKHGIQWDFCTCVEKNDSILEAFNTIEDENLDELMLRSDFIDSKCNIIRATPNTTPEERGKHEKAIKACRENIKR